jgi:hypothetical protein
LNSLAISTAEITIAGPFEALAVFMLGIAGSTAAFLFWLLEFLGMFMLVCAESEHPD